MLYSAKSSSDNLAGALVNGSNPDCVLGNGITSRIESALTISAINLSMPIANPACCGVPYDNASINQPNLSSISLSDNPHLDKTPVCIFGSFILCEPEPSSTPLSTRS